MDINEIINTVKENKVYRIDTVWNKSYILVIDKVAKYDRLIIGHSIDDIEMKVMYAIPMSEIENIEEVNVSEQE